jgi:hypothetical protein
MVLLKGSGERTVAGTPLTTLTVQSRTFSLR